MANFYGNPVANSISTARVYCPRGAWTALQVGSSPLGNRQWIEFQVKGRCSLAILFANVDIQGNFTAPIADLPSLKRAIIYPANAIVQLPVGDKVTVYGRAVAKAGATEGGVSVAVAEFS